MRTFAMMRTDAAVVSVTSVGALNTAINIAHRYLTSHIVYANLLEIVLGLDCIATSRKAQLRFFTSFPISHWCEIYCNQHVCLSVCLYVCIYVCPLAISINRTSKLHQTFCACCLWPQFGSLLAMTQYTIYFRFRGWCLSALKKSIAHKHYTNVQFTLLHSR